MVFGAERLWVAPEPTILFATNNLNFVGMDPLLGDLHDRMLSELFGVVCPGTTLQDQAFVSHYQAQVEYPAA
jgi:hypothetical protein